MFMCACKGRSLCVYVSVGVYVFMCACKCRCLCVYVCM